LYSVEALTSATQNLKDIPSYPMFYGSYVSSSHPISCLPLPPPSMVTLPPPSVLTSNPPTLSPTLSPNHPPSETSAPQPEKKKRGRPATAEILNDAIKARLCVSVAIHRISMRNASENALMWMSLYEPTKMYENKGLSRSTTSNVLLNVYGRVLRHICFQIVRSKKLTVLIDGTTDRKSRSPLAIRLTGIDYKSEIPKVWSYPLFFVEPGDHKAKTQCQVIQDMLREISLLVDHKPGLTLLDIDAIVFDSTSSNTGKNKGLVGQITNERKQIYSSMGNAGDPPKLVVHMCEDHILNLMSSDYEAALTKNNPSLMINQKHRATDVVQFIIAKVFSISVYFITTNINNNYLQVGRHRREFRHYMRKKHGITKFAIPRISDTRFSWRDIAALFVWKVG
jgi:hypothetical protein